MVAQQVLPRLVVGLGNPGPEYAGTRHNAGFAVVERLVERFGSRAVREHRYDGWLWTVSAWGGQIYLATPLTFMNLSGRMVARLATALALAPGEILVVYDCLDLPLGRLRLRSDGGSGGHRGVESVIAELGSAQFPRLRIGIGRSGDATVVDHVLSPWTVDELPRVSAVLAAADEAVVMCLRRGVGAAMNAYNGWRSAEEADNSSPEG